MKPQKSGKIITIGSSGVKCGRIGQSAYLCSKNALKTLSECLSLEGKEHNNPSDKNILPRKRA